MSRALWWREGLGLEGEGVFGVYQSIKSYADFF